MLPILTTPCPAVLALISTRAGSKLRDVPAFEHSHQLAAEAAALPLPANLQAAVQAAMPLGVQQRLAEVPACQLASGGASAGAPSSDCSSTTLSLDPWLLLEGGSGAEAGAEGMPVPALPAAATGPTAATAAAAAASGAAAGVPPWLGGAVKRRRRDLCCWPAPHVAAVGPPLSVEEQLQQRAAGAEAVAANG